MKSQPQPSTKETGISRSRNRHPIEPVLMETSEVAAMLSMSTSWVYKEASKLGLKGYKLGRGRNAKVLYKRAEVFKWLEQQKIL
ncbi:helix-turn-helix domain-containing protein [Streptomyces sp. NPDC018338]|uniref:helix-turn-helix domain-containing protein n=1 Tax=Streptomyces sp. NPDC018338 TaxID=3157192 RepID=UPI0033E03B03